VLSGIEPPIVDGATRWRDTYDTGAAGRVSHSVIRSRRDWDLCPARLSRALVGVPASIEVGRKQQQIAGESFRQELMSERRLKDRRIAALAAALT